MAFARLKWPIVGFVVLAVVALTYVLLLGGTESVPEAPPVPGVPNTASIPEPPHISIIGSSVEGRSIDAYTFGSGDTHILFVGGIHGGYEWNSVVLAYKFIDYLNTNPDFVPEGLTVSIVPSANPDGVFKVVRKEGHITEADAPDDSTLPFGTGRFNANNVDLNRNFACKWQPKSMWRGNVVSAGTAPFSEPEVRAIRDYVGAYNVKAVVFWHSQSNAVYASECEGGILPETLDIMNAYASAAGYPAVDTFDAYSVTGDAEGWLASLDIPALTVELSAHDTVEWEKNLSGVTALLQYYSQ